MRRQLGSAAGARFAQTLLAAAAGVAVISFLVSCASVERVVVRPPDIPGASFVGNAACADCHSNLVQQFPLSPHARVHFERASLAGQTSCEACHGPGSLHIASGGGRQNIINPGKDPAACLACHKDIEMEFRLPSHHPVLEGKMNCVQCHDPHGRDIMKTAGGLAMARVNQQCAACHLEQSKPHVFEHEALREGCTVCHRPHGTVGAKLLLERDANLCLKCHAQTPGPGAAGDIYIGKVAHGAYLRQGTCWSAGCHSAVHGSNLNPRLRY
jgi:predicted CXXCH cytochrome family protein